MPRVEVIAEPSFRKESFTATLVEKGIKLMGQGENAQVKAYLRFDDNLPPLTYFVFNQKGEAFYKTDATGIGKTRNFAIGQVIEYLRLKKGIRSFVNLDPGQEQWDTEPPIEGMVMTFEAFTPKVRDEAGNITDGFTNFTLVAVDAPDAPGKVAPVNVPAPTSQAPALNLDAWKAYLKTTLTTPHDEKGINKAVQAYAKTAGKTPEQLGLGERKKALKALMDAGYIDTNVEGDYILVV